MGRNVQSEETSWSLCKQIFVTMEIRIVYWVFYRMSGEVPSSLLSYYPLLPEIYNKIPNCEVFGQQFGVLGTISRSYLKIPTSKNIRLKKNKKIKIQMFLFQLGLTTKHTIGKHKLKELATIVLKNTLNIIHCLFKFKKKPLFK